MNEIKILQNLQNKNLQFFNQNYWEFEFDNNSIIYADPPYLNTTGYDNNEFDFEKFDNWVRDMKNKGIRVYISEYTNHNNEWREVVSIDKIALACNKTLSGTKKVKQEKLFCNI